VSTLIVNAHTPVDATGGVVAMTLPTSASNGDEVSCEKYDTSVNATITGNVRGTAGTTIMLSLLGFRARVASGTTSWWPIYGHKTLGSLDGRFGRPCTTDGTNSLPAPTGVGLEFVITASGLQDIRFNGVSL
jgi:hypothetical protein